MEENQRRKVKNVKTNDNEITNVKVYKNNLNKNKRNYRLKKIAMRILIVAGIVATPFIYKGIKKVVGTIDNAVTEVKLKDISFIECIVNDCSPELRDILNKKYINEEGENTSLTEELQAREFPYNDAVKHDQSYIYCHKGKEICEIVLQAKIAEAENIDVNQIENFNVFRENIGGEIKYGISYAKNQNGHKEGVILDLSDEEDNIATMLAEDYLAFKEEDIIYKDNVIYIGKESDDNFAEYFCEKSKQALQANVNIEDNTLTISENQIKKGSIGR